MNSKHDVLVHPVNEAAASEPVCPHCGGKGVYRPELHPGEAHYGEADFLAPCPFCSAYLADPQAANQSNPLNDTQYRASGHEMQVFACIGILLLLVGGAVGVVHAIAQTSRGAIPSPFYNGFLVGWVLLGLAAALAVALIVYVSVRHEKKS